MMEDLSLHILDVVENAVAAGATRVRIAVNENEKRDFLTIRVADNGRGMRGEVRERALDPFFTTGRKRTGLGLPLLAQAARQSDGELALESAPGRGTKVVARFRYSHLDRQPLTKMAQTMLTLVVGHPEVEFGYRHRRNGRDFRFASGTYLKKAGRAAVDPRVVGTMRQALQAGLKRIGTT
ncbi:MAG: ATP-binding protein [Candidatus Aminicenantes bacterium]|nr:ATP-binding protein [Candidatus Aminicenantes bacterium]